MLYLSDDGHIVCKTFVKGCTPGARLRDGSFTNPNDPRGLALTGQADRIATLNGQVTALAAQVTAQLDRIMMLQAGVFHPHANLAGANLSGAFLSGADLFGANLVGANLTGVDLSDRSRRESDGCGPERHRSE